MSFPKFKRRSRNRLKTKTYPKMYLRSSLVLRYFVNMPAGYLHLCNNVTNEKKIWSMKCKFFSNEYIHLTDNDANINLYLNRFNPHPYGQIKISYFFKNKHACLERLRGLLNCIKHCILHAFDN